MGVGAAAIMPSTLSVITTSFEGEERGKAIGIWVGIAGGGAVIGLFGTAILLEFYAWNSFFALNMVLATLGLIGTLAVLPESKEVATHRLDWIGALLTIIGVGAAILIVLHILGDPMPERGIDGLITSGSCVDFDEVGAAFEVSCNGPHQAVVRELVPFDSPCDSDTTQARDRQGMGTVCIEP